MKNKILYLFLYSLFLPVQAQTNEITSPPDILGQIQMSHYLLDLQIKGGLQSGFDIGNSQLGFSWQLNNITAQVTLGPDYLINQPYWSDQSFKNSDEFRMVEAYGKYQSSFGHGSFLLGKLPLYFGHPHEWHEDQLWWGRSYLFSYTKLALRDYGLQHYIEVDGFFSRFSIHNGEGAHNYSNSKTSINEDDNFFYTMTIGKKFHNGWLAGMAGHIGSYVDSNLIKKYRLGNVFISWRGKQHHLILSASSGEDKEDDENKEQFASAYLAYEYICSKWWKWRIRGEAYDPNLSTEDDGRNKVSLGLSYWDKHASSSLHFVGSREELESGQTNDQFLALWRLKSNYFRGE